MVQKSRKPEHVLSNAYPVVSFGSAHRTGVHRVHGAWVRLPTKELTSSVIVRKAFAGALSCPSAVTFLQLLLLQVNDLNVLIEKLDDRIGISDIDYL